MCAPMQRLSLCYAGPFVHFRYADMHQSSDQMIRISGLWSLLRTRPLVALKGCSLFIEQCSAVSNLPLRNSNYDFIAFAFRTGSRQRSGP